MSSRYVPVQHEMDAAFDDSDDEDTSVNAERAPLNPRSTSQAPPGAYDFENLDYDYPPPGSPPPPTSTAFPNSWGNSNGNVPDFDVDAQALAPRRNWLQRSMGAVLPASVSHRLGLDYQQLRGSVGGGTGNDGVFANVSAKPTAPVRIQDGDNTYIVPEDTSPEAPPSYAAAQADAVPQYWETTIHAPFASDSAGDMIIDALPTGSLFSFLWNMLVSISFQFIGFLLTYLLHTSHSSRLGSRAGLGVTLIQYGFALRSKVDTVYDDDANPWTQDWKESSTNSNNNNGESIGGAFYHNSAMTNATMADLAEAQANAYVASATTEWLSFFLMTIGWFILLTSVLGFWRVKRWESGILATQSTTNAAPAATTTTTHTDNVFAFNGMSRIDILRRGFGLRTTSGAAVEDHTAIRAEEGTLTPTEGQIAITDPERARVIRLALEHEQRLQNDLRAAGLL